MVVQEEHVGWLGGGKAGTSGRRLDGLGKTRFTQIKFFAIGREHLSRSTV